MSDAVGEVKDACGGGACAVPGSLEATPPTGGGEGERSLTSLILSMLGSYLQ